MEGTLLHSLAENLGQTWWFSDKQKKKNVKIIEMTCFGNAEKNPIYLNFFVGLYS